jgi:DHA3 family macrolide efflux protein-like MFS transporter
MKQVYRFTSALLAQVLSRTGSQMMGFALGVLLYQRTGSVALNAELAAAILAPEILLSPLGGIVVDRFDRGRVLCAGHLLSCICAATLLLLSVRGGLTRGAVLGVVTLASAARAAELTAWAAATATMVSPSQLGRANGAVQLGLGLTHVFAPALAAAFLERAGIDGVLAITLAFSFFAAVVFGMMRISRPEQSTLARPSFSAELTLGLRWVLRRPTLVALLAFLALVNSVIGLAEVLITPVVLSFADARTLSLIFALGAVGVLLGAVLVMLTRGPRRRIDGILIGGVAIGVLCVVGCSKPSAVLAAIGVFGAFLAIPIVASSSESIWQTMVPLAIQGRVFAVRAFAARLPIPLVFLGAGWLADTVFEPLLRTGGVLAVRAGPWVQTGPGRGSALLLALSGGALALVGVVGLFTPRIRGMEAQASAASTLMPQVIV